MQIAEGVALAQRISKIAGSCNRLAPCIVPVFYYQYPGAVKQTNDGSPANVDVSIEYSVETDLYRAGLHIVEELELIGAESDRPSAKPSLLRSCDYPL